MGRSPGVLETTAPMSMLPSDTPKEAQATGAGFSDSVKEGEAPDRDA
jgi:hypothetical protein